MWKKAKYWFVPCLFNEDTMEVKATNLIYDKVIDVLVWFDFEFRDGFYIKVYDDGTENL